MRGQGVFKIIPLKYAYKIKLSPNSLPKKGRNISAVLITLP